MGYLATGEVPQPQGSGAAMIVALPGVPDGRRLAHDHHADGRALRAARRGARPARARGRPALRARTPTACGTARRSVPALEALTRPLADGGAARAAPRRRRHRGAGPDRRPGADDPADQGERDARADAAAPTCPTLATVALPVRFGTERPAPRRPPPRVGEHTIDVLGELGFGAVEMGGAPQPRASSTGRSRVSGASPMTEPAFRTLRLERSGGRPRPHGHCSTGPRS